MPIEAVIFTPTSVLCERMSSPEKRAAVEDDDDEDICVAAKVIRARMREDAAKKEAAEKEKEAAVIAAAKEIECVASAELVAFLCEIVTGRVCVYEESTGMPVASQIRQWLTKVPNGTATSTDFSVVCAQVSSCLKADAKRVSAQYDMLIKTAAVMQSNGDSGAKGIRDIAETYYEDEVFPVHTRDAVFASLLSLDTFVTNVLHGEPRPDWQDGYKTYYELAACCNRRDFGHKIRKASDDDAIRGHLDRMHNLLSPCMTIVDSLKP